MTIRAFIKNRTASNQEIGDIGVTVIPDTLYDLCSRPPRLLAESSDLPAALLADTIRLVALDRVTEYSYDTAIALLNGADPNDPLTWGKHVIPAQYFRERFTVAEQVGIIAASHSDDEVKNFYDHLQMSRFVDLSKQLTANGLDLLISKQLLDADRKAILLAV